MSGCDLNLSEKQLGKLFKLQNNLQDVLKLEHDDFYLRRFLVATNFDIRKSEEQFRKHLMWRTKIKMDAIVESFQPSEVCQKCWVGGFLDGYDKDGYPIWILPVGTCDPKGLLYSCKTSELITYMIVLLERAIRRNKERYKQQGKNIDWGVTLILDLQDLGLRHLWKPFVDALTEFLSTTEQNYPETSKKLFVINAPALFPLAYSLIRPFLPQYTREKVQVLGAGWKDVLLQHIDADVLPVHWGGTKTDPDGDPKCSSLIKPGGTVDTCYYKRNEQLEKRSYTTTDIPPGSKHKVSYEIKGDDGGILRYQFKSREYDMGFYIKHKDSAGRTTVIKENKRYNSHLVAEDDELLLDDAGIYVLTFDNSYSWTRTKTISYWVEILELSNDAEELEVVPVY